MSTLVDCAIIFGMGGIGTIAWIFVIGTIREQLRFWKIRRKRKEEENK